MSDSICLLDQSNLLKDGMHTSFSSSVRPVNSEKSNNRGERRKKAIFSISVAHIFMTHKTLIPHSRFFVDSSHTSIS